MTDRTMTIAGILMVTLVIGGLLFRAYFVSDEIEKVDVQQVSPSESKRTSRVLATVKDCSRIGKTTRLLGSVRNTGNTTLSLVSVQPLWKNDSGLVLGRGLVYVVNSENPLAPGHSRDFEDVTRLRHVTRCNVEPLDWGS